MYGSLQSIHSIRTLSVSFIILTKIVLLNPKLVLKYTYLKHFKSPQNKVTREGTGKPGD